MTEIVDVYDLTPLQEGLLFHALRGEDRPEHSSYLNHLEFDLLGPLDQAAFRAAWQQVVDRHDALRAGFHWAEAENPVQAVHAGAPLVPVVHDLSALPEQRREAELAQHLAQLRATPLDLAAPPLMRLSLFTLTSEHHRVLWTHHHLVLDGWSLATVFAEAMSAYRAQVTGTAWQPGEAASFGDHLRWLRGRDQAADTAFWSAELAGLAGPTALPRTPLSGQDGYGRHAAQLTADETAAVRELATGCGVTPAVVLRAATALALNRYTGSRDDLVFGTTVAGRPAELAGVESMVGLFINTVPVRVRIDRRRSVREFLADEMARTAALQERQYTPLSTVQRLARVEDLFDTLLVVENFPLGEAVRTEWGGLRVVTGAAEEHTHYPLTLTALPGERLRLEADWRRDRVDDLVATGLLDQLRHVLAELAADPDRPLGRLAPLPAPTAELLRGWGGGTADLPQAPALPEQIAARAAADPTAVAVRASGVQLDYAHLVRAAGRLATALRERGIGPGDLVGVALERGAQLPVALLAVLTAGAGYVPLDPELPAARRAALTAAAGLTVVLGPADVDLSEGTDAPLPAAGSPDHPAYVVFTSGSTGTPKGVVVTRGSLARHSRLIGECYGLDPTDRVLLFSQPSFDVAAEEIFATLAAGATVVVHPPGRTDTIEEFRDLLEREGVTVANLPAAYWHTWQREAEAPVPKALRLLVVGNEKVWTAAAAAWRTRTDARVDLLNAYGITETTITSTLYRPPAQLPATEALPVGRPVPGTTVSLLDTHGEPVPPGVPGELHLGGSGVALGYLGDPARTAERFVPDPRAARPGARCYRSGDLGRWLAGGVLALDGRADEQVQIRGHRVEPGEVEAALCAHPAIAAAAVVAVPGPHGTPLLVAHLVPADPAGPPPRFAELAAHLAERLPRAMVPTAWSLLPVLPLLPSGKVDRRALPAVRTPTGPRSAPRGPVESWLAEVWQTVLNAAAAPVREDDFFALGGDSLAAVQVTARVRRALGSQVPVRLLFDRPTLAGYARAVQATGQQQAPAPAPADPARRGELAPGEERLWFLQQMDPQATGYHLPVAFRLTGALDVAALGRAITAVSARHPALRTRYLEQPGGPLAQVDPVAEEAAPAVEAVAAAELTAVLAAEARRPFDLAVEHPVRFRLLRTAADDHVLALTAHHIAVDGWSLSLLLADLATAYRAALDPAAVAPPNPALDFRDFAVAQRDRLAGPEADRLLAFWRDTLAGAPQLLALPTDRPRPPLRGDGAARHCFTLPAELAERVKAVATGAGSTPFVLLLAAYQLLLHRYSGQDDLLVGVPVAGRLTEEAEAVCGNFVNTLPLRAAFAPGASFTDLLGQVRHAVLDAFDHQELPFDRMVDALAPRRDLSHPPLVQALFAFQNTPAPAFALPGVACAPLPSAPGAQLDLSLAMAEQQGTLAGVWEYSTELFDAETVAGLSEALLLLLTDVCADPDAPLERARLLDRAAQQRVARLATGPAPQAAPVTLTALLAERVAATPEAPALLADHPDGGTRQLSWAELDAWAGRIAAALQAAGIGRGDLVGVHARRDAALPAALWGVLRAGAGYVPLDPDHPEARLAAVARAAGLRVVLTQQGLPRPELPAHPRWIAADGELPAQAPAPGAPDPADAAYVLFTSGSTGIPKGVVITHANVTSYLRWFQAVFQGTEADRLLLHTAYSFDVSVPELFGGLLGGGATVLLDPRHQADARATLEVVRRHRVSYLGGVPSYLRLLADDGTLGDCPSLRLMVSCGEGLPVELAASLRRQSAALLENQYGPTETTVTLTGWRDWANAPGGGLAPLGVGAPGCGVHVLDRQLRPVPPGVAGEIHLTGPHLARGYLGDPARTARAFLPDPFSGAPGARMYRSGDLSRQRRDGTVEFLGRIDRQTKLRGFRVELGDIEAALRAHPEVRAAAVLLDGEGEHARLVGYAARTDGAGDLAPATLHAWCAEQLPGYLVPAVLRVLDELPLNANGKVDHRALAALHPPAAQDTEAVTTPPEGPTEQAVAASWAELLGRPVPGRDEDFFELGGNSLLAARAVARLRRDLGVELPVRTVFTSSTVRTLAAAADEALLATLDESELTRLLAGIDTTTADTTTAATTTAGTTTATDHRAKGPGHDGH
ncbi:non-ribosomal peptide synthetase [Kitasatospora sp. NBC_01302]|uniref:non-ribosomal peptide synthetase n=1 Tax=Kitasatospora sp. NBC_01302 TaxID=2903575 RepID=UPI002E1213A7|nr:non-ribosomal peptide synthetase [Kitasatospora sp. NBC_01302]WSJ65335.1 amino acid adenylation domain-containing protein [Kitasatospora sp. NBC_01302]